MTREEFDQKARKNWGHRYNDKDLAVLEQNDFCCTDCGDGVDDLDDYLSVDAQEGTVICEHCYRDNLTRCACCNEGFEESHNPNDDRLIVNTELAAIEEIKPGIYQVLEYPYFMQSVLGNGFGFFKWAIELIVEGDCGDIEISGLICDKCFHSGCDGKIRIGPAKSMELGNRYGHAPYYFYKRYMERRSART